ncbi:hypothetical protein C4546_01755 [Candidatus Parcubacteria bacterium]|nr:MAG: hypothetical protein C4546_01755 [Candidatus Parcubacteria bacterium]
MFCIILAENGCPQWLLILALVLHHLASASSVQSPVKYIAKIFFTILASRFSISTFLLFGSLK